MISEFNGRLFYSAVYFALEWVFSFSKLITNDESEKNIHFKYIISNIFLFKFNFFYFTVKIYDCLTVDDYLILRENPNEELH